MLAATAPEGIHDGWVLFIGSCGSQHMKSSGIAVRHYQGNLGLSRRGRAKKKARADADLELYYSA